jgi:hypothetical protein
MIVPRSQTFKELENLGDPSQTEGRLEIGETVYGLVVLSTC